MADNYYTPQEVADKLGFKVTTIWNYIRTGKMECTRASARCYRISEKQLQQFLQNNKY